MKRSVVIILLSVLIAGCTSRPAPNNPPRADKGKPVESGPSVDLSKVDRVVVTHYGVSKTLDGAEAARLAKALTDSPTTSPKGAVCREEFDLELYTAGTNLVATAAAGVDDRPIVIDGETGVRQPSAEARTLFTSIKAELADPYTAQFIPYCEAWTVAQSVDPNAPWRLLFMTGEELTAPERRPLWLATAIGPDGSRRKALINPLPNQEPRLAKVLDLAPEVPSLPLKEGKPPLAAPQLLALVCNTYACTEFEPVDIEFRPAVQWPMSDPGDNFPAWGVTFARKVNHRMDSIGLYEAYTGGLVTMEMPPK